MSNRLREFIRRNSAGYSGPLLNRRQPETPSPPQIYHEPYFIDEASGMKLSNAGEMQAIDSCAINHFGIPGAVLMENAGLGTVLMLERELGPCKETFAVIFVGPGNNGGDGLVIGRHLHQRGCHPVFFLLVSPDRLQGDAAINMNIVRQIRLPFHVIDTPTRVETVPVLFKQLESNGFPCYCIVDAIFGTGLTRDVTGHFENTVSLINRPDFAKNAPIISVDMPSGMDTDSGRTLGCTVRADVTATFGCAKPGQIMQGSSEYTGSLHVIDIGLPPEVFQRIPVQTELITEDLAVSWLGQLRRENSSHKGKNGHLFLIAGSLGKTGAAVLAARGALRSGCGLVSLAAPNALNTIYETNLVEAMTIPLPASDSFISAVDTDFIRVTIKDKTAAVLGPGLGQDAETADLVLDLFNNAAIPMVVDADALNILAASRDQIRKPAGLRILTPHPGELARLTGRTPQEIQDNRLDATREAHSLLGSHENVIVILKGDGTIVVSQNRETLINSTGNPGMATGGMGDVLSGVIGAMLCQGLTGATAAAAGIYLHGAAADDLFETTGYGYTASEVADQIPYTLKRLINL